MDSKTVPTEWNFTDLTSTDSKTNGGIGTVLINGLTLFVSTSAERVDPYYPQVWSDGTKTEAEMTDSCIGHPDGVGLYHYHIMSPCIMDPNSTLAKAPGICMDNHECHSNLADFVMKGFDNYKRLTPVGLSKDGHPVFGPYGDDG